MRRLDLWEVIQHAALLVNTTMERKSQLAQDSHVSDEIETRDFNSEILNSRLWAMVRGIHGQGQEGVREQEELGWGETWKEWKRHLKQY